MPSLDTPVPHQQNLPYATLPASSMPYNEPSAPSNTAQLAALENQLQAANTALSNANASISSLQRDKDALYADNQRLSSDLSALKAQLETFKSEAAQTLNAQQTSLARSHSDQIAQIQSQSQQAHSELMKTIDQLKREKAEMQGVVQLLQQKIANPSPASTPVAPPSPDLSRINEEKAKAAALSVELQDAKAETEQLNRTISLLRQELDSSTTNSKAELDRLAAQHAQEFEKAQHDFDRKLQLASSNSSHAEAATHSAEVESLRSQLGDASSKLKEANSLIEAEKETTNELRVQLTALNGQLAEKEESLKRATEQAKSLQSQTSVNFAQVEQMKQQVLRDRVELSKKLSLIAPETVRRVEQLTQERDAINMQFEELVRSLAEVSKQKSEVLSRLALETSRNTSLVKQNVQLRHQLKLQLSALGEPADFALPHSELVQDSSLDVGQDASTSADTLNTSPKQNTSSEQHGHTENGHHHEHPEPQSASTNEVVAPKVQKAHGKIPPRRKPVKPKAVEPIHHDTLKTASQGADGSIAEQQKKGWLSSVPLVGRMWNSQQQVRHTAHVEI